MTISEQQGEQERLAAEDLIAATKPFSGVEKVDIELGDDHTGEPSMWLVFHIRPGLRVDEPWIRAFGEYRDKLRHKLIHSGLTRFPYSRIEPAA